MRTTATWIAIAAALVVVWMQVARAEEVAGDEPAPGSWTAVEGRWVGTTEIGAIDLPFSVVFEPTTDGCRATADMQGHFGLPLEAVACGPDAVHFELAASIGRAVWHGRVRDGAIVGSFSQNLARGTFRLELDVVPDPVADAGPPPYAEEDVTFRNGDITLAGTVTVPDGNGPHPGVVLVSGSGAQDRDEELFGFRPFRVLADAFARRGVAVLRYDDRGVGGSDRGPEGITSEDLAGDVAAAVRRLREHTGVDAARVGVAGHSEGGILAPMVANRPGSGVAFVVLLAAPAIPGDALLRAQSEAILEAQGVPRAAIEIQLARQARMFDAIRTGEGWEALERETRDQVEAALAMLPADQREDARRQMTEQADAQLAAARSPWMAFFVKYDPRPALVALEVPALAVFGTLDTQVPPAVNVEPMRSAFAEGGNGATRIDVIDGVNHLFQEARTGDPGEYAVLTKAFGPGFLERVVDWVVATTASAASETPAPGSASGTGGVAGGKAPSGGQ